MRLSIADLLFDIINELIWTVNCSFHTKTHTLCILKKVNDCLVPVPLAPLVSNLEGQQVRHDRLILTYGHCQICKLDAGIQKD